MLVLAGDGEPMDIEFTVEFLTLAAREPESAAPVDLNVPIRLRGLETTRRLQAYPATARLPVTALAALSQGEVQQEPRDVGFAAFLSEPSASSTRLKAIRRLLPGPPRNPVPPDWERHAA